MLNRRYLRIKVMQALYAYFQSDANDMSKSERDLLQSIDKVHELYVYLLTLLTELTFQAGKIIEEAKSKKLPTQSDLSPNTKFIDNLLIKKINDNKQLVREVANRKVSWQAEGELVRKILTNIKSTELYQAYMSIGERSFEVDKKFIIDIYKECVAEFDLLEHFFEQRSIYWIDDMRLVNSVILKSFESSSETYDLSLVSLYKDEVEDKQFVVDLFRKTVINEKESEKYISEKTKNWEVDRIALMDVLLMKMSITEILHFTSIPIKVSLNEYIEISKTYSSPKSKIFINGILDKLVQDFKEQNKLQKTGRGLIE